MTASYSPIPGVDVLTTAFPIPGMGLIPVNAFVLHGDEPVLVDTGATVDSDDFMAALRSVIDPAELRWLWLTHTDFDHVGSLGRLLREYPDIRVATNFLGVGILSLHDPLPMDRVYLLNPGQQLELPDRTLTAFRPPVFDNPSTMGFYDDRTRALVSSDCFGAVLDAVPEAASDLSDEQLRQGQVLWATVDAPWLHDVDPDAFRRNLDTVNSFAPELVLSSHLPAASSAVLPRMLEALAAAPAHDPFFGPDQAMLESMMG
ncbi:MAG: MBL fold metallo-hydrolase [Ilumatobacter sp.]|nr:MBL fold metallo-hydrolase [Ilumatobacter sp.]